MVVRPWRHPGSTGAPPHQRQLPRSEAIHVGLLGSVASPDTSLDPDARSSSPASGRRLSPAYWGCPPSALSVSLFQCRSRLPLGTFPDSPRQPRPFHLPLPVRQCVTAGPWRTLVTTLRCGRSWPLPKRLLWPRIAAFIASRARLRAGAPVVVTVPGVSTIIAPGVK